MSFAAVGITVACLVVMGTFSLVAYNAQVQLQQLESEYEILAFVDESCDDAQTKAVGRAIEQRANVKECVFISKEEAMKSFEARYEGDNMFQNLDPEILRDRYAVYVDDLSISGKTAQDILDNVEGVANVRVDEDIAGGFITLRNEGTEIILYKSLGDVKITIEDYTGKNASEIKGKLEALKLQVIITKKDVDLSETNDYKENIIIDQSIKAGEKISEGDTITLYIPKLDNKYPDFVNENYSIEEVESFCDEYGVILTKTEVETSEYEAGKIIYQSRAAGSTVVNGARLTVKVAKSPSSNVIDPDNGDLE